jgi:hypothetical protein
MGAASPIVWRLGADLRLRFAEEIQQLVTKVTNGGAWGSIRIWPDSTSRTTHWLPIAVTKTPIVCNRNGFPRPVVLKER